MRVGVIGTGFGTTVAKAFERTDGCHVVDVVSPRDDAAVSALCARTDIDLISVHSPPHLHRRDVERSLQSGHHVVCDKPFGHTLADATAMHSAAGQSSTLAFTTFELRFEPWRRSIDALLGLDGIGPARSILWYESSSAWSVPPTGWQSVRSQGGGWLGASASHAIDTLRRWLGDLRVQGADIAPLHAGADSADGGVSMLATGDAGARCTMVSVGTDVRAAGRHIVINTDGGVVTSDGRTRVELEGGELPGGVPRPAAPESGSSFDWALAEWCGLVRDAVRSGHPQGVATFDDALVTAKVIHDIRAEAYATF
ncbi:Gfo/Idh/MocA family protein [Microbacterium sp. A84]|uniref:Gfo/Idh/MocA family protein n=1 Tax=Microbacterium sp. A84 TaxID=3450715 RepID=UPI003F43F4B7